MNTREKTRRLTTLSLLAAIIVALQIICTFIKFGPFSITLALTPIIIGAALFGISAGAFLGFVFGLTVFVTGILGWDGGFVLSMMGYNAVGTTFICLAKGTVAGLAGGAVYKWIEKKSTFAAVMTAGVVTPIVNTGLFALAMMTLFNGFLTANLPEGATISPIGMLFVSWIGVNFIVEFFTNLALGTVITRIIRLSGRFSGDKK